jgi:ribosomal protein L33
MAKKGDKRKIIGMIAEETGERLYYTTKNTMNTPEKLS